MCSDVLLGHSNGEPAYLRYAHRTAHVAILGKSRYGKTTLLEHLVLTDMNDGTAAIVVDAHGDLTKRLITLAPVQARANLVLVEPNSEQPFGLNLYERPEPCTPESVTTAVGHVVDIFNKLMGSESAGYRPIIDPGLRNTARTLIANGLTMAEIPMLYRHQTFRRNALRAFSQPGDYWQEYEQSDPRKQQEKREPVLNKVARFLEDDLIALMVSQTKTSVPLRKVLEEGGTLLLNLAGLDRETVSFLGMVCLSVLSNLLHQRESLAEDDRKRLHLYLDEYGRFATPTTHRMLEECGKYGLGATIAHQNFSQTPEREALKVETLICFQLSGEDAANVAQELNTMPVRVRQRLQQRTEPQYRKWDEEVWVSETLRSQHQELLRQHKAAQVEAERAQRLLYLLRKALNRKDYYKPEAYPRTTLAYEGYFPIDEIQAGEFNPNETSDTWHIPFNPSGYYFDFMSTLVERGSCTYGGLVRYNMLGEAYLLGPIACQYTWFRWLLGLATERTGDRELTQPLIDELPRILAALYTAQEFYFKPSRFGALDGPDPRLKGEERSLTHHAAWPLRGDWNIARFPGAVAWLADHVSILSAAENKARQIDDQCQALYARGCAQRHNQEYLGERPVVEERWEHGRQVERPLYHLLEDTIQTSADRAAELANTFTQLPRYVAYCKLVDSDGSVREFKLHTPPPAAPPASEWSSGLSQVRARSRERFGTPREQVDQEIRRRQALFSGGQTTRVAAKQQPAAPAVDLAQATAREKWQREHPIQVEEVAKQPPQSTTRPSIGRRSPKSQ
ncbi:type IV secretory system conjugative DNA transfer family protein [Streptomyces goshikiensis]|uniref:type IV secretory system conjugative DNA transfer family protein n=1 Tax=Streptomyces goshikiensis TaxID=1942 RepID=UPI0036A576E3